jgi:hypothetical protein
MQRFSTQSKLNLAQMTWKHIFQAIYISFSDSYLVHEMSLWQKWTYAPPQYKARGLNIHDSNEPLAPYEQNKLSNYKLSISKPLKTCQDHIKAFTHKRTYMWHFSKTGPSTMDINQDYEELSQTNHIIQTSSQRHKYHSMVNNVYRRSFS